MLKVCVTLTITLENSTSTWQTEWKITLSLKFHAKLPRRKRPWHGNRTGKAVLMTRRMDPPSPKHTYVQRINIKLKFRVLSSPVTKFATCSQSRRRNRLWHSHISGLTNIHSLLMRVKTMMISQCDCWDRNQVCRSYSTTAEQHNYHAAVVSISGDDKRRERSH